MTLSGRSVPRFSAVINPHNLLQGFKMSQDIYGLYNEISSFAGTFVLNTKHFREIPIAPIHDYHPGNS